MNQRIVNSIYKYIEVIYMSNQQLIKIFGIDSMNAFNTGSIEILNIIQDVPRLIPYTYNKKTEKYELSPKDGLLVYKSLKELPFEYQKIFDKNKKCLIKIKKIRNKWEHILHNVNLQSCYTGNNSWFRYTFKVKGAKYTIESDELIALFKDLNILYDQLIKKMLEYSYKKKIEHPFYNHLHKVKLLNFNKLYDSGLLYEIGKSITGI